MGVFIQITADQAQLTPQLSKKLVSLCPVDIFGLDGDQLVVKPDQEDECTLCRQCLLAAPYRVITITKTYSGEVLVSGEALKQG